jgi:hypothetical protein
MRRMARIGWRADIAKTKEMTRAAADAALRGSRARVRGVCSATQVCNNHGQKESDEDRGPLNCLSTEPIQ